MKLKKVLSGFLATAIATTTVAVSSVIAYAANATSEWITNSTVSCDKLTDVTKMTVTATVTDTGGWGQVYIYCATNANGALDMSKVGEAQTTEVDFDGSQGWYQIGYIGAEGSDATLNKIEFQKANGDVVYTYDPSLDTTPEITKVSASKYTYTAEAKADSTSTDDYNAVTPKPLSVDLSALLPTGKTLSDVTKITVTPTVKNGNYGGAMSINIVVKGDPNYKWTSAELGKEVAAIECPLGLTESNLKLEIQWINYETDIEFDVAVECGVTVTSVTVTPATLALKVGDAASQLTATVEPEGAAQDVVWASSNTKVATVSTDGKVTAVASGDAEITATAKDTTVVGKCTVTVTETSAETEEPGETEEPTTPGETEEPTTPGETEEPTTPSETEEPTTPADGTSDYALLYEGTFEVTTAYEGNQIAVANAVAGDKITVTYEINDAGTYHQLSFKHAGTGWPALTSPTYTNEWNCVDVSKAGTFTFTLNAEDAANIVANKLVVSGYSVTITKVELNLEKKPADEPAEPSSYETGNVETVTNYVPTTAGTKLVVMSITEAEAASTESYTITVTDNNGKTTSVTTNDCYKAFKYNTANGVKTETAANGFFIIVKVTGVPEGTTVSVTIEATE